MLYATLLVCSLLTAVLVYRYDLYDREPIPVVALAVGLGYLAMWGLGPAETLVVDDWLRAPASGTIAVVSASLEELAKLAVVLALARALPRIFDEPMDGVIYGSMAGLGAAVQESVAMIPLAGDAAILPPSELVRVFGHLVMGGMGGAGVGLVVVGHPRRWLVLGLGFGTAVLLHFVWDYVALVSPVTTDDARYVLVRCTIMAVGLGAYGWLVAQFSRLSRQRLAPDSRARLWGWPFVRPSRGEAEGPS